MPLMDLNLELFGPWLCLIFFFKPCFLHLGGTELAMLNSVTVSIQSTTLYTAGRPEMDQRDLLQTSSSSHFNVALM